MVQKISVEGYDAYKKAADEHKGKMVFAHFSGSTDPATGKSWCPDCVVGTAAKDSAIAHFQSS